MEPRLVALKLFLDALGVSASIDTIDDRKRVQKAVYIGQLAEFDLGYRFGWYLRGPYSSSLAKDYYSMAEALESEKPNLKNMKLAPTILARFEKIKPIFNVPKNVKLQLEGWLELLASIHFLNKVSQYPKEKYISILKQEKNHLVPYVETAEQELRKVGLLS